MKAKDCYRDMQAAEDTIQNLNRMLSNITVTKMNAFGEEGGVQQLYKVLDSASSLLHAYKNVLDASMTRTEVDL